MVICYFVGFLSGMEDYYNHKRDGAFDLHDVKKKRIGRYRAGQIYGPVLYTHVYKQSPGNSSEARGGEW